MKLLLVALVAGLLVFVAVGPPRWTSVVAGLDNYDKELTGKGAGGPDEVSWLTLTCDDNDVAIAGGYRGIDTGSRVVQSSHQSKRSWRVAWLNDGTRDTVTVYVRCHGNTHPPDVELVTETTAGTGSGIQTVSSSCSKPGGLISGGYLDLPLDARIEGSFPVNGTTWVVNWRGGGNQSVSVRVICYFASLGSTVFSAPRTVDGSSLLFAPDCGQGNIRAAAGFSSLEVTTKITMDRPAGSSWRFTFTNPGTDQIVLYSLCRAS